MKKILSKRVVITMCSLVVAILAASAIYINVSKPYAIIIDGQEVALVNSELSAKDVKKAIINDYKAADSTVLKSDFDKKIKVEKIDFMDRYEGESVFSKKKVIKHLEDLNGEDGELFTATVVGQTEGKEYYTPDTVYIKNESMYAGEKNVKTEGKEGVRQVTRKITTVNGEEIDNEITEEEIVKKGTAAVIEKGTIGLPEGADWETYEGEPVFDDGGDLVDIALLYQGVPYRYGGNSLITGVDCVTFVTQMYKKYGISLPNSHKGLRKSGVGVSYSNMKPGDVLCYSRHVAIYIGNGKIIHATSGKGVHISNVYKGQKLVTIRRIAN